MLPLSGVRQYPTKLINCRQDQSPGGSAGPISGKVEFIDPASRVDYRTLDPLPLD